jgi:endonuclease/exonuclease/phosphatase family metal-dependent hydrolase
MFTVMTYNVGNGLAGAPDLVSYLRKADADLVGLQELTATQAEAIAGNLVDVYPYRALFGTGIPGKGVLSRYPLVEMGQLHLSPARPDLRAVVDLAGAHLTVIVAHTPPPRLRDAGRRADPATTAQLRYLADLAIAQAPAVLLGDFNMTARSAGHALLTAAGLSDAFQQGGTGHGFTLPARLGHWERMNRALGWPLMPFLRVDYIWLTTQLHVTESWTERGAGSDHRPVLARLQLNAAARGDVAR